MKNPFEIIEVRLHNIETLLLAINHETKGQDELLEKSLKFLSVKQAANFLNLSVPTIYSKCSKGEIPYMKKGKRLYFSQTELTNYLKSGRVKTNDDINETVDNYLNFNK